MVFLLDDCTQSNPLIFNPWLKTDNKRAFYILDRPSFSFLEKGVWNVAVEGHLYLIADQAFDIPGTSHDHLSFFPSKKILRKKYRP